MILKPVEEIFIDDSYGTNGEYNTNEHCSPVLYSRDFIKTSECQFDT